MAAMASGGWRWSALPQLAQTAVKGLEMVDHVFIIRQRSVMLNTLKSLAGDKPTRWLMSRTLGC
jgi:hypothetical protein